MEGRSVQLGTSVCTAKHQCVQSCLPNLCVSTSQCVCVRFARVYAAGWWFPLKMPFSIKKKKKITEEALTTGLVAWVLDARLLCGVLLSKIFLKRASAWFWVTRTPKICLTDGSSMCGSYCKILYGIGSIFYVSVCRRAGMLRIHPHQYPRCIGKIKNISRYNLWYLCLVWLLSCILNPLIRAVNCLLSQCYSK